MSERMKRPDARSEEAGFSLLELLLAVTIMLVVVGGVFSLIDPGQGISKTQPEVADVQERMRVSADILQKDLMMAGAGAYSGAEIVPGAAPQDAISGALANYFPPVLPRRAGLLNPDPDISFFDDRITITYVPDTASQTTVFDQMPSTSAEIKVKSQPGCPDVNPPDNLCGFKEGMRVLIYDNTGAFDFFTITQVQSTGPEGHLQHNNTLNMSKELSKAYDKGARIALIENHVYWLNRPASQLTHYDGIAEDIPMVDDVVQLRFRYFGDPNPPLQPRTAGGNCVVDAAGQPLLPVLPSNGSSLVELTGPMLTDGPICGTAPNRFDGDLYRVRKVRVELRMQVGPPELRGKNPGSRTLFVNPGNSTSAYTRVPDYSMTFEVAPRNLNLFR